jgi:hypothetical protein
MRRHLGKTALLLEDALVRATLYTDGIAICEVLRFLRLGENDGPNTRLSRPP